MKVLVTGGAGFIGSHITEALCNRGAKVIVLDNLSSGKLDNLAWARGKEMEFVQGDIGDTSLVEKIISGCEWVFHQGAQASVPYSVAEPEATNRQNLDASLQLMIASRRHAVRRFVFASSSSVYGNVLEPTTEETAVNPLSPYALQKFASERYGQMMAQFHGLETVSLRYFNVFGPRQSANSPYSGVIAKFCAQILAGTPPTIFGDGKQSRDFVYIDNVVQANLQAAESPKAAGKVYNIGTGESVDLLQLVDELNRITRQNLQPAFAPARPADIRFSLSDISAAKREISFEVTINWKQGLEKTVEFYRSAS